MKNQQFKLQALIAAIVWFATFFLISLMLVNAETKSSTAKIEWPSLSQSEITAIASTSVIHKGYRPF